MMTTSNFQKNDRTHHVAIIGGRKSGKTTLCASLHQSLIARAHGYSPNMIARFPDAEGLNKLEKLFAAKFNAPKTTFQPESSGSVREIRIGIDFGTSKWSLFRKPNHELQGFYQIAIDDLRDDFDLMGEFATQQSIKELNSNNPLAKFEQSLNQARSLIICQPALQKLAPSESTGFIRLMSDIATGRFGEFENIIIAFTKYERIFTNLGAKAFNKAVQPSTILETMAKTIHQDTSFETGLRALMSNEEKAPNLYAIPVSSFGFLRQNGAPNLNKMTETPISVLSPLVEEARSENPLIDAKQKMQLAGFTIPVTKAQANKTSAVPHPSTHWLPFLTADPFLAAVSGQPSQFMIPISNFISALDHGLKIEEIRKNEYLESA